MYYKTGVSRDQVSLFNTLEDSIGQDNYVRLIDALVEMLYKQSPEKFAYNGSKGTKERGRKPYHPCDLLKLYLYGYLNRINSSRRLEKETYRNIEVKWLLCDLHPDHKTIADYRKDNTEAIRYVTLGFRRFLRDEGFIGAEKIIYDGSKIKACASKEKVLTTRTLSKRIKKMEEQLSAWLCELDTNDHCQELAQESDVVDINKSLLEEIASLRQKIKEMEELKSQIQASDHSSYCPTDRDAHLMKSRDGFIPAYNVQVGTDSLHKMIVFADLTPDANDIDTIGENVSKTKEQTGIVPQIVEADKGYGNIEQIKSIEANQVTSCAIPLPDSTSNRHDKKAGVEFEYDQSSDSYTCSQGKLLKRRGKNARQDHKEYYLYKAKTSDCTQCSLFGKCTTSKSGRRLKVPVKDPFKEEYVKRLKSIEVQALIKERKDHIEHVFATIKRWMGKVPLLLTSKTKVQTEIDLYATAYNLRRLMSIENITKLLDKMAKSAQIGQNMPSHTFLNNFAFLKREIIRLLHEIIRKLLSPICLCSLQYEEDFL